MILKFETYRLRNLGDYPQTKALEMIESLPENLESLDLSRNDLHSKTGEELVNLMEALPETLQSLNLRFNGLYKKTAKELLNLMQALPKTLQSLNLGGNGLHILTVEEWIQLMQALPKTLKSLDLSLNDLCNNTGEELVNLIQSLPKTLRSLNLRGNYLHNKTGVEWVNLIQALPKTLKSLNLGYNDLDDLTVKELVNLMQALPNNLQSLNLRGNDLYNKTGRELVHLMQALPETLQLLDLGDNNLSNKTGLELVNLIRALPKTLQSLGLQNTNFNENQLNKLADALQDNYAITTIQFDNRVKFQAGYKRIEAILHRNKSIPMVLVQAHYSKESPFSKLPMSLIRHLYQQYFVKGMSYSSSYGIFNRVRKRANEINNLINHDKKMLPLLKSAVESAVTNYTNWSNHKSNPAFNRGSGLGIFTRFRHGRRGLEQAKVFLNEINKAERLVETVNLILDKLNDKKTRFHCHSFVSYLLDALKKMDCATEACKEIPVGEDKKYLKSQETMEAVKSLRNI